MHPTSMAFPGTILKTDRLRNLSSTFSYMNYSITKTAEFPVFAIDVHCVAFTIKCTVTINIVDSVADLFYNFFQLFSKCLNLH